MTKRTNTFPKARTDDLITERVGGELVVYDGQTSEAHCLSAIAPRCSRQPTARPRRRSSLCLPALS